MIYVLILGFALLTALGLVVTLKGQKQKLYITFMYLVVAFYTLATGLFYANNEPGGAPDENAHISYIYYMQRTGEIIPHFEDMRLFSDSAVAGSQDIYEYRSDIINYLCHPPLYYKIMCLAADFTDTDNITLVQIDKMHMRYFSMVIFAIGMGLLLYIGYSRLDKKRPLIHLIYAIIATSIPMFSYEACAVTNDNLAIVTGCVAILGLLRFCEGKRNCATYAFIAGGITSALLTKMTAALMCIIAALLVLIFTMLMEHSVKKALPKAFWITAPIYLLAFIYYAVLIHRYGTIQPNLQMFCSTEYFQNTTFYTAPEARVSYSFDEYRNYYFERFFLSWSGIEAASRYTKINCFTKASLPANLLWIIPVFVVFPFIYRKCKAKSRVILASWIACGFTFLYQFKSAYGTFLTRGYRGGFQSRYYLPFMFLFAFGTTFIIQALSSQDVEENEAFTQAHIKARNKAGLVKILIVALGLGFAFLLFYANLPFFIKHFVTIQN